jgi:hypothetical protein
MGDRLRLLFDGTPVLTPSSGVDHTMKGRQASYDTVFMRQILEFSAD